jgi:lycopene beta-cyclase
MIKSQEFSGKKILLIDKSKKNSNDRTWCFWETGNGFFEDIVFKKWDTISFKSEEFSADMNINPYHYKMIRGLDFYQYCFREINKNKNIEVIYGELNDWQIEKDIITLNINGEEYKLKNRNTPIFNSIYKRSGKNYDKISLLQHFKGWVIQTDQPVFNPSKATIMDFRVEQEYGTTFTYVLPIDEKTALIEYTLFTKELLPESQYDHALANYINSFLKIEDYQVMEKEFGVIPMTSEKFSFRSDKAWFIGTAGGQTKSSSGYTFQFIQKQSELITNHLVSGKPLSAIPSQPFRFRFYDNTLLHILYYNQMPGKKIFTDLFKKNKPVKVLKFLDNESSILEELKIISSLPAWTFLKAAMKYTD